jgi:hypothetical protein
VSYMKSKRTTLRLHQPSYGMEASSHPADIFLPNQSHPPNIQDTLPFENRTAILETGEGTELIVKFVLSVMFGACKGLVATLPRLPLIYLSAETITVKLNAYQL